MIDFCGLTERQLTSTYEPLTLASSATQAKPSLFPVGQELPGSLSSIVCLLRFFGRVPHPFVQSVASTMQLSFH